MKPFIFESYDFDNTNGKAMFRYMYGDITYEEVVELAVNHKNYNEDVFQRALFLAFILIGTSYFKAFPTSEIVISESNIDSWQAKFFSTVYQEGLSQFAFENKLTRSSLAHFLASEGVDISSSVAYKGDGVLSLQSGGKDSLLVGKLLRQNDIDFTGFYISSSDTYPKVIDKLSMPLVTAKRNIDHDALSQVKANGGLNGHVPVTYIVLSIALLQAILNGNQKIIAAIGHEGEEPHAWIDDLPVNHQWSKTWHAEQMMAEYVQKYISSDIQIGSVIRQYSELEIARQFTELCWEDFYNSFSSCNVANYGQGIQNEKLSWCGNCPKCANSYLLFSPFIPAEALKALFGSELFTKEELFETFKGLLGVEDVIKPFECVGEIEELRYAYHEAIKTKQYDSLPFTVPVAEFDPLKVYPSQSLFSAQL